MRNLITPLLAAAASVLITAAPADADLCNEVAKILPDDGVAEDVFGKSVAMDGAIGIIGAPEFDGNADGPGAVYVFDLTNGKQLWKLLLDDGEPFDRFGTSVAISGTTAIAGAPNYDTIDSDESGAAFVFDTMTGEQRARLLPDGGGSWGDKFGRSVAISGDIAVIGAVSEDVNGLNSGAAYLFDTVTGQQLFKLLPDDGATGDHFGLAVEISGSTAIVGAERDEDNGDSSGSAYLFDVTTGAQTRKLVPDDGLPHSFFGHSVAIGGNIAIVGAPQDDRGQNGYSTGSAYLFDTVTGEHLFKLLPDERESNVSFGVSVGISGSRVVVGAYRAEQGRGSACIFDISDPKNPVKLARLFASDPAIDDEFAYSIAIDGPLGQELVLAGSWRDEDNGVDSGSAYLFDLVGACLCPWDLDDNGGVVTSDLITLLGAWGKNPGHPADFDGDGNVGTSDLIVLLGHWGQCP